MMIMSLLRVGAEGILRQRNVKIFYKNTFWSAQTADWATRSCNPTRLTLDRGK